MAPVRNVVALLLAPLLASGAQLQVTPVQKVIDLLGRLGEQVQEEGAKEAAEYDKFACFCKHEMDEKTHQIEKSTEKIAKLTAKIDELASRVTALDTEVADLGQSIATLETDISTEEAARTTAHEEYLAKDKDVTGAIDAVEEAIELLRNSKTKLKGDVKLNLAQLAKLAGEQVAALVVAQNPHASEYKSNDIIGTLEGLKDTFKANKKQQDQDEYDASTASEKKVLALANEKKFKAKSKAEKEQLSAELSAEKSAADQEKTEETTAMDADTGFRTELTTQCETKAAEWDQRSKSRAGELQALAEATETLKSGVQPNYGANKKLVGLAAKHAAVGKAKAVSLLQLGKSVGAEAALGKRVVDTLAEAAERLHSSVLGALVAKLEIHADHFAKVRGLINDLIAKLEAEALSEADQKSFCDTEMAKAVQNRDGQSLALEEASAKLVGKESEKAQLLGEIKDLSQEIAELNKALMEATELRQAEKEANAMTVAEAGEGKVAVQSAITVLEGFYNAFLQQPDRDGKSVSDLAPATSFSGDYKGNQDASKGIIGLLNVILSDFERTETSVAASEAASQADFEAFEGSTKTSISDKETLVKTKEGDVEAATVAIVDAKKGIKTAGGLKESALAELEKLSAMCVAGAETFEERKAAREKEIEALKEAMKILDEWKA